MSSTELAKLPTDTGHTPTLAEVRLHYDPTTEARFTHVPGEHLEALVYAEFDRWWATVEDEQDRLREKLADVGLWPECQACGCTDAEACLGGCSWAVPGDDQGEGALCSNCAPEAVSSNG